MEVIFADDQWYRFLFYTYLRYRFKREPTDDR